MAGKSRQPSHEPPRGGRKQAPVTLKNSGKKGRDRGGETASKEFPRSGKRQRSENAKTPTKLLQRPMDQAPEESWHMRISNKPLTAKFKLVLLVVNSVKLHLTALKTTKLGETVSS